MVGRPAQRYALAPWSEIRQSDLEPQGAPETELSYRHETHLGLHVRGTYGITLGLLAVRCETHGELLVPISLAIADTPGMPSLQSGTTRAHRFWTFDRGDD